MFFLKVLQRKEKECSSLLGKCEDEQTLAGKLNTQIKELQARLDEIDEDLEAERQGPVSYTHLTLPTILLV